MAKTDKNPTLSFGFVIAKLFAMLLPLFAFLSVVYLGTSSEGVIGELRTFIATQDKTGPDG